MDPSTVFYNEGSPHEETRRFLRNARKSLKDGSSLRDAVMVEPFLRSKPDEAFLKNARRSLRKGSSLREAVMAESLLRGNIAAYWEVVQIHATRQEYFRVDRNMYAVERIQSSDPGTLSKRTDRR